MLALSFYDVKSIHTRIISMSSYIVLFKFIFAAARRNREA